MLVLDVYIYIHHSVLATNAIGGNPRSMGNADRDLLASSDGGSSPHGPQVLQRSTIELMWSTRLQL